MDYSIEKKEGFGFYGMTKQFTTEGGENFKEIPKWWQAAMADGSYKKLCESTQEDSCLGVCMPMDPEKDAEFDYMIGVFASDEKDGYDYHLVPEAEWAVFQVRGSIFPNLQEAWKQIYSEWFPHSGVKHAALPEFEVYLGGDVTSEDYRMEIWIPIER